MNRLYVNQRGRDVRVPGRTGNEITVPAGMTMKLDSWFDRYVPYFLSVADVNADLPKAVRPAICEVPRNDRPMLVDKPATTKMVLTEKVPADPTPEPEEDKPKKKKAAKKDA